MESRFFSLSGRNSGAARPDAKTKRQHAAKPKPTAAEGQRATHSAAQGTVDARRIALCSSVEARAVLPLAEAVRLAVLPLALSQQGSERLLRVACRRGTKLAIEQAVRFATGLRVLALEVEDGVLEEAVGLAYHRDAKQLQQAITLLQEREPQASGDKDYLERLAFLPSSGDAANLLMRLIEHALALGASDLHISPNPHGSYVRIRVSGSLRSHEKPICTLTAHQQMIARLRVLCALAYAAGTPQDGSFRFPFGAGELSCRVSLMPTLHGEKAVLRFLGTEQVRELEQLGFSVQDQGLLQEQLLSQDGLIVVAGATGSGKTSTLYSMLRRLEQRSLNIVSIEDPVEIPLHTVTQTALDVRAGLTYATALRAMLRQDPDVVMLGELREEESAQIASQAALTGHLVLTSIHARDLPSVVQRLSGLGCKFEDLIESLRVLLWQSLVPVLCECKVMDLAASKRLGVPLYREVGCAHCDYTGYARRVLLYQLLIFTAELRQNLRAALETSQGIGQCLQKECLQGQLAGSGILPQLQALLREGKITQQQFLAHLPERQGKG
jgi:protein transport protein HofB